MLRVLVTGANGFIGRRVCSDLTAAGHSLRAAVRDATRARDLPGESVSIGRIDPHTDWSSAVAGVDAVIHLAARVHVMREGAADPLAEFRAVNDAATQALARDAAGAGVKRFVYVSSIKVNGEATVERPFSPDDPPAPRDPYGISKCEAERALARIARETGLEVSVVRPPLVYGSHVGGNFLRLLDVIRRRIPLPVASVSNRRSMIYVGNLSGALMACATHSAAAGKTYLVNDGDDISTPDLVARLARLMGKRVRLWACPPGFLRHAGKLADKSDEVERLVGSLQVDGSAIRRELGWSPAFTLDQGLAETVHWFLSRSRER